MRTHLLISFTTLSFCFGPLAWAQSAQPTPATAPVANPAPAPVAKPAPAPVAKPVPAPVAKPVPAPVAKPAPAPVAKPAPAPVAKPLKKDLSPIVAQVGDQSLSLNKLNTLAQDRLEKAEQEHQQKLYEIRAQAIDEYLSDAALNLELAAQKQDDIRALIEAQVITKISPVSEAEVEQFYQENKERLSQMPENEVRPQIQGFLTQQRTREGVQSYISGLRQKYKAVDLLEPPRVKVDTTGFAKGPQDAPITIVEFADYECGYCSRAMESINTVMAKYPGKIRLVYRDFPLEFHQNAVPASIAARCAGAQSKFWEMHIKLFENQSGLTAENFTKWAQELGLDMTKFDACSKDQMVMASIQADIQAGSSLGVSGTPAFFVNGISLSGAQPPEAFVKIIDRELSRSQAAKK